MASSIDDDLFFWVNSLIKSILCWCRWHRLPWHRVLGIASTSVGDLLPNALMLLTLHHCLIPPKESHQRLELMDYWILPGDHFVTQVKVLIMLCHQPFSPFIHFLLILAYSFSPFKEFNFKQKASLFSAIHNLANKYREEFQLPNLKLPFNNRQGFYFSIPHKDMHGKLPSKFIQHIFLFLKIKHLPLHFVQLGASVLIFATLIITSYL